MKAQEMNQPSFRNPFDEEEENELKTKLHAKRAPKEHSAAGKVFMILGVITACVICMVLGMTVRNSTTLFLEKRTMEGYLAPEDYILLDKETGKPVHDVRTLSFKTMHSWDENGMMTNRGIRNGSSWDDFVDAYSDITADSFTYYKNSPNSYTVDYSDSIYLYEPMTVAEFEEQYRKTGEFDPETDRIYVDFELYTDGIHLYYTEEELQAALDKYYDSPFFIQPVAAYPRNNAFHMGITLSPEGGVEYIVSSYY